MMGVSGVALAASFLAGIVSFLSPCVLPLVPGYLSYVGGRSLDRNGDGAAPRFTAVWFSISFVLGFSTVFITLGASATVIGRLLLAYKIEANLIAGVIVGLFGLTMIGLVNWPWLLRDIRFHPEIPGGQTFSAYVLGLAFALGWTPCIGPVLSAILVYAGSEADVGRGLMLLGAYSAGLALPFLFSAVAFSTATRAFGFFKRHYAAIQLGAGAVLVGMGVLVITGELFRLNIEAQDLLSGLHLNFFRSV